MPLPITFANLAAGNQPLSDFDTQFAAVAALGQIPCLASGTNAITLTPFANTPTISSYPDLSPSFIFSPSASNTGAVTLNVNGVGARNAYKFNYQSNFWTGGSNAVVQAGDLQQGGIYRAVPLQALNGGAGGFIVDSIGSSNQLTGIEFIIDGGGSAITTGNKGWLAIPFPSVIGFWYLLADQVGSIQIDILRGAAAFPVSSIVGGGVKPNLSGVQGAGPTTPSGWTSTTLALNDWIAFNVTSVSTVTRVTVVLYVGKL